MFIQMNVRLIFVLTMILIKIENKAIHEETMIWQCDVYCFQAVPNTELNVFDPAMYSIRIATLARNFCYLV